MDDSNLSNADLRGVNLCEIDLAGVNLSGAKILKGWNLMRSEDE